MADNLKIFERLIYASVALDILSTLIVGRPNWPDVLIEIAVALVQIALAWAAARHGQRWAAWVLVVLGVVAVVATIAPITGPTWLTRLLFDTPPTTVENVFNVISLVLFVAGLYFYFFRGRAQT